MEIGVEPPSELRAKGVRTSGIKSDGRLELKRLEEEEGGV
jgi:hypothetical protein